MAWLTAAEIKAKFNFSLQDTTSDEPIEFAMESAAVDLEDWLEAEDYDLAIAEDAPSDANELKRYNRTVQAHAYLTIYYVYLNNTQIRAAGSVKQERDENNATTNTYLTPAELKTLREQYLEQAKNLIAKFSAVNFSGVVETDQPKATPTYAAVSVSGDW